MIIWKFKGTDTKFRSTPASHDRDIFKMAKACGVPPETEIIYEHGKPNRSSIEDTFSVSSDTSTKDKPALPKATKARKPRKKASARLLDLSGNVDSADTLSDSVESGSGDSDTGESSDSLAE